MGGLFPPLGAGGGYTNPIATPVVDYDFKQNRLYGPALSVVNASGGYIDDSAGNWSFVPANTLRRSDKGALIEGAQTNSIRNNSMQGAVAGTPGTLPTNWSISNAAGLSSQVVGSGTTQGMDYVDVRFFGTSTGVALQLQFEANTIVAAVQNQLWSFSAFLGLQAGTLANVTGSRLTINTRNSSNAFVAADNVNYTLGTIGRKVLSATLSQATAASITPVLSFDLTNAAAVDFTLRIGWPQLEQWSTAVTTVGGASSPIRTTGTAATRSQDFVSFNGSSLVLNSGTIAAVVRAVNVSSTGGIVSINDIGNTAGRLQFRGRGSPNSGQLAATTDAGANFVLGASGSAISSGFRNAYSFAFALNDTQLAFGGALDGSAGTVMGVAGSLGTGYIGGGGIGSSPFNGYIERLAILPARMVNAEVQRLATLATWGG